MVEVCKWNSESFIRIFQPQAQTISQMNGKIELGQLMFCFERNIWVGLGFRLKIFSPWFSIFILILRKRGIEAAENNRENSIQRE